MIGKLTGYVDTINEENIILDVNGVGYLVFCSSKTLNQLSTNNEKVSLFIETIVREDSITLFGFIDTLEQECFNTLCKVNGVGNKMAVKILSVATPEEIISGIMSKDKAIFTRASGVGDKLAIRIITELEKCPLVKGCGNIKITTAQNDIPQIENGKALVQDSVKALESLGYQRNTVYTIVVHLLQEKPYLTLESIITESLRIINNF